MTLTSIAKSGVLMLATLFCAVTTTWAQTLQLENLDGVPYPDRLSFSRIGSLATPPPNGVHERVTLRLKNTGASPLSISGLTLSNLKFTIENRPALPASIAAGDFLDLQVRFVVETNRRVHSATLTISSNDPFTPTKSVELSGYWQPQSENNKEPTVVQLMEVFGYTTEIIGPEQVLNQNGRIAATGEEVISAYWKKADGSKPVTVRQLAAFHGYPSVNRIFWHYKGSTSTTAIVAHEAEDAQSILPRRTNSTLPAQGTFNPSSSTAGGIFGLKIQNEWSDPTFNDKSLDDCSDGPNTCGHHIRIWPARDRAGVLMPNTFIVTMDNAGINYDYNDNVYLVSNIAPESPVAGLEDVRINAGGPAVTTGGQNYIANVYASGGASFTPSCDLGDIQGTTDDVLYRTEYSEATIFSYAIPAQAGSYTVRLHFAEIWWGSCSGAAGGPGKRVFDVSMEGALILDDLDIYAEVGAVTALVKTFQADMTDGILNLDFTASVNYPMISAVEVLSTTNQAPVASFTASPNTGEAPLSVNFDASASNDPDGSIMAYAWVLESGVTATGVTISHTFNSAGTYDVLLTVTDNSGVSTTATQTITVGEPGAFNPFAESGGQVVFEAENFHDHVPRSGKTWNVKTDPGAVGTSMRPEPATGTNIDTGYSTTSPELQYRVQFTTPGTYHVWMRAFAADGTADSWHVGLDGQEIVTADRIVLASPFGEWRWTKTSMGTTKPATIGVTTAGEHVINLWMREDGAYVDRLLLTTDAAFIPAGNGPVESPRTASGSNLLPTADFTATPTSGQAPLTVNFDAGASSDPDGSIDGYSWDFDGDSVIDATFTDTPLASFTYDTQGTFTPSLRVVDDAGGIGTTSRTITVAASLDNFTVVSWSTVAPAPEKRSEGFGGFASDGKLYLFGGYNGDPNFTPTRRVDAYDPITNSWTSRAALPTGLSHAGVAVDGDNIYFAGGYPEKAGGGQTFATDAVWKYNTTTNTYSALPSLPSARGGGALAIAGTTLHFFGGADAGRNDAATHWTLSLSGGTSWGVAPSMPAPRNHLGGAGLNGRVYAVGGQAEQDASAVLSNQVYVFDPVTGVWTTVAPMPVATSHINASTFAMGRRLIVAGGDIAHTQSTNAVYAYDPSTNAWVALTSLPGGRIAGVADDFNGNLYFTTGSQRATTYRGVPQVESTNVEPTAQITALPTSGSYPLTVDFDGAGSTDGDGFIVSYDWDFGDGGSGATGITAGHTYTEAGNFVVTLVVADDDGGVGSTTVTITVTEPAQPFAESGGEVVMEAENHHTALGRGGKSWVLKSFAGSVGSSMRPEPVTTTNIDVDYAATSPEMQFRVYVTTPGTYHVWGRAYGSDGNSDSWHVGTGLQQTADRMALGKPFGQWRWTKNTMDSTPATLQIDTPGEHLISVWMREDGLYLDRILLTTNASFTPSGDGPPESARYTDVPNTKPTAAFTMTPTSGTAPLDVEFDAGASFDSDGTITSYRWDFGDGNTGSGALTSHSYSSEGSFTVMLVVTDNGSYTDTTEQSVVVDPSTFASPSVTGTSPVGGAVDVSRDTFIAADVDLPNVGMGIDASTLTNSTVRLYPAGSPGSPVPANVNTSGGGDAIVLQPTVRLAANTPYTFEVTSGLKDLSGTSFIPFAMSFWTGSLPSGTLDTDIAFSKVALADAVGKFTTLVIGPEGKLYATQNDGIIKRWTIQPDGTLSNMEVLNALQLAEGGNRLLIGLAFSPNATADSLVAWVSHTTFGFSGMADWGGKITRLSGSELHLVQDFVVNLPRSIRDHVTNGVVFGPDGALYVNQGSNTAMGDADNAWGNRPERMLTAAVLRVDVNALAASGTLPLNVQTADEGSYTPYASNAPVKVFASGVRNAYDLVWHSNGFLYLPTNGSAAGGKAPASVSGTIRPDGTAYSGPAIPAIDSVETQNDFLFRVAPPDVSGSYGYHYFGHPNPTRGEYVLNGGNPTSGADVAEVFRYPTGITPDVAWRGIDYNFGRNISPNGIIEYKSGQFDGALQGKLLIVRYSGGDDIIVLSPDATTGAISSNGDMIGISGFTQFSDPLDLIEHPNTGNIYVAEYGGNGKITLLQPAMPEINEPPTASFVATPNSGDVPLDVTFDPSSSSDSDGTISMYEWDFNGDAIIDTLTTSASTVTHTFASAGTFTASLKVTDNDGDVHSTAQSITVNESTSTLSFEEAGGLLVAEVENFDVNIARGGKAWTLKNTSGNVGANMRPEPVTGVNLSTGYATTSPELQYRVRFNTTGTYFVWVRAWGPDGSSDSWHIGLDSQTFATAEGMTTPKRKLTPLWTWSNVLFGTTIRASIEVPAAGEHILNLWMREDGVYVDRVVLTTDPAFTPSGDGPPESPRTAPASTVESSPIAETPAPALDASASDLSAEDVPHAFALERNYPNPFNPVTTIRYALPEDVHVTLEVFDVTGRRVAVLVDAVQPASIQSVQFDARNLPSGTYFYRIRAGSFAHVATMILLK